MSHEAIDKCPFCGSDNISRDCELESWKCNNCDSYGGGASFWK